jgi:hypothetical protein
MTKVIGRATKGLILFAVFSILREICEHENFKTKFNVQEVSAERFVEEEGCD